MARMYSRRRGKSKSTHPLRTSPPDWIDMSVEEIEQKIVDLQGQGYSSAMIGTILRDSYGIVDVKLVTGKRITKILEEKGKTRNIPEDLENLIVKALKLRKHLDANPKDLHNKRALQLTESKVRRLVKYYIKKHVLPEEWRYKPETMEVLIGRD